MGHGCYERYYEGALSGLVAAYLLALGLLALRLDGQQRTHCPIHSDCFPFFHLLVLLTTLTSPLPSISGAEPLTVSQERAGYPPGHSAQPPSSRSGSSDSRLPRPHRSKQPLQTLAFRSALVVDYRRDLGFANGPLGPNLTCGCVRRAAASLPVVEPFIDPGTLFSHLRLPSIVLRSIFRQGFGPALYLASGFERCFSLFLRRRDLLPATASLRPHHHHRPRPPRLPRTTGDLFT
jgi:hypothetical protein